MTTPDGERISTSMKSQKTTKDNVRVVSDLDQSLARQIDAEREEKGRCSRAAMIRMALMERYRTPRHRAQKGAESNN